eukprot:2832896-Pleurochrysis_carterae.AAC.2
MSNTTDKNDAVCAVWKVIADEEAVKPRIPNIPRSAASLTAMYSSITPHLCMHQVTPMDECIRELNSFRFNAKKQQRAAASGASRDDIDRIETRHARHVCLSWRFSVASIVKCVDRIPATLPIFPSNSPTNQCMHAIFTKFNYHNNDMSIPTHMINGGNVDTLDCRRSGQGELVKQQPQTWRVYRLFDFSGGHYDAGGFTDSNDGVVHGGNCQDRQEGSLLDLPLDGNRPAIAGYHHDNNDNDNDNNVSSSEAKDSLKDFNVEVTATEELLKKTEELLEEARKSTTATSTSLLHIGGSAATKYRPKSEAKSDISMAAEAMQDFTKAYVEQCAQDRVAMQQDSAAARELLKAELAQQIRRPLLKPAVKCSYHLQCGHLS